ncbi:NAD-dependent deacylase [Pseudomonas sp. RIT-To-2]|uniref:NAD-dependent deacylase n=1 Tax=Pseudomonas sp. RIT-To-2 TaxID=3462541 RepID=UPI00241359C6
MVDPRLLARAGAALREAERILVITGAGLSADSGLPTYRGLGGLYNGVTAEGMPIEKALSGPMLERDPALCWKYLAQLGRACLDAKPNAAHEAIARLQQAKPECWLLTQNIDGYHRLAGSPDERLIEIHGQLAPLFCRACGAVSDDLAGVLGQPLPPRCKGCNGVLRPPVVLFEEMLPQGAIEALYQQMGKGFDAVLVIGTTASFPYIHAPIAETRAAGGFAIEINPLRSGLSASMDVFFESRALEVMPKLMSHIFFD